MEKKEKLLQAAQLAPTGRNTHSWEFVVVEEKETPCGLGNCRNPNQPFLPQTPLAIVVLGDPPENRYLGRRCRNCLHCDTVGSGSIRTWFLLGADSVQENPIKE